VYRSINRSIDQFISGRGISAPEQEPYRPVWEPREEVTTLDGARAGISAIVWCIGFGSDFRFIKLPLFDERGYPEHQRGVTSVPGLYFVGLPWLHTWGSGRFSGVGRDAEFLATAIAARASVNPLLPPRPLRRGAKPCKRDPRVPCARSVRKHQRPAVRHRARDERKKIVELQ
jgi:putative flavoprotein involved in K+ transport